MLDTSFTKPIQKLPREALEEIGNQFVELLRKKPAAELFNWASKKNYHGFEKTTVRQEILQQFLQQYNLEPGGLQIELGGIKDNYLGSVHAHSTAHALAVMLGKTEGFSSPVNAYALVEENWSPISEPESFGLSVGKDKWFPLAAGDRVYNPTNFAHSFTVKGEGQLYFVVIQSPAIDQPHHDDWVPAKIN
jgi:hypothetical protein